MTQNGFILFDGAMGTQLQRRGLKGGSLPELLNLTDGDIVRSVHEEYVKAGADIITTNTFGANSKKLGSVQKVEEVIKAGIRLAREAGAKKVALDLGPSGSLLKPMGDMSFDEAYELYRQQVAAGQEADLIIIETMSDLLEAKAALLAAKENSSLPVFVTMTFGQGGRTFLGITPRIAAITLSSLGADAVGINCSLGPREVKPLIEEMLEYATVPVMVQPNAGLPEMVNGEPVYGIGPDEFVSAVGELLDAGVTIVGGCCGTSPEYTRALREELSKRTYKKHAINRRTVFTGTQNIVTADDNVAVIGNCINPAGKKYIEEALRSDDMEAVQEEAISQGEDGADILSVSAALPDINEPEMLEELVSEIQGVSPLPLQINSADPEAIERAVRCYCGKPIISSVSGKEESLCAILPIVKKYGAAVVAATLDEGGVPETAEGRLEIAEKIVGRVEALGIPREDVLIDCLPLPFSGNDGSAAQTLRAVSLVKERLGLRTVLGISGAGLGLPEGETANSGFLTDALNAGLNLPIIDTEDEECMEAVESFRASRGED